MSAIEMGAGEQFAAHARQIEQQFSAQFDAERSQRSEVHEQTMAAISERARRHSG